MAYYVPNSILYIMEYSLEYIVQARGEGRQ